MSKLPKFDWNELDKVWNWIAKDSNNNWYGHNFKPTIIRKGWKGKEWINLSKIYDMSEFEPVSWVNSLNSRPYVTFDTSNETSTIKKENIQSNYKFPTADEVRKQAQLIQSEINNNMLIEIKNDINKALKTGNNCIIIRKELNSEVEEFIKNKGFTITTETEYSDYDNYSNEVTVTYISW